MEKVKKNKFLDDIRQAMKWQYYKLFPKKCDHSFGTHTAGYRTIYCNCCNKDVDYIPVPEYSIKKQKRDAQG